MTAPFFISSFDLMDRHGMHNGLPNKHLTPLTYCTGLFPSTVAFMRILCTPAIFSFDMWAPDPSSRHMACMDRAKSWVGDLYNTWNRDETGQQPLIATYRPFYNEARSPKSSAFEFSYCVKTIVFMDGFIFLVRVMSSKRFAIKSMASATQ